MPRVKVPKAVVRQSQPAKQDASDIQLRKECFHIVSTSLKEGQQPTMAEMISDAVKLYNFYTDKMGTLIEKRAYNSVPTEDLKNSLPWPEPTSPKHFPDAHIL